MNAKTITPTRANTPRGTQLRVLVDWVDEVHGPDFVRGGVHGGTYYQGPGILVAWPPGDAPRIRLDGGTRVYGSECWWTWMERGKRRAMPRRATVRRVRP